MRLTDITKLTKVRRKVYQLVTHPSYFMPEQSATLVKYGMVRQKPLNCRKAAFEGFLAF